MNQHALPVKTARQRGAGVPNLAALKNVAACMNLVNRLTDRSDGLPGIGVMYSPSGYGKTYASLYAQNKTGAIRVECGESWNRKTLMRAVLLECGEANPKGTVADLMAQAIRLLGDDPFRPLFIDEADKLVDKNMIELVREIHEHSQVPVLLIGEELLPRKLMAIERVHNRVLAWLPAAPCDLTDCRKLADVFLGGVEIGETLLTRVMDAGEGRARRVVTSLSAMKEWAVNKGVKAIPDDWSGDICTGQPPVRSRRA